MTTRRTRRRLRRAALPVAAIAALGLLPPVQARFKAAGALAETLGLPLPRPLAPSVERTETSIGGIAGDLYSPGGDAPGLVIVHGAAPGGKDDPRLVRLARALARSGRTVFVPGLRLAQRVFTGRDIERIVAAISGHAAATGAPVAVLGISYGGSFAMIAAADARVSGSIEQLALFGAYYDIVGVVQAVTTGVSIVDGERIPWDPDPRAASVLRRYVARLAPQPQRAALRAALDGRADPGSLGPDARALYELVVNDEPERTRALAARLDGRARALLARFSPSEAAGRIRAPVIVLHSTDDPVVPYGEAVRIVSEIDGARLATVELFRHVDLAGASWLRAVPDLFHAWRFTSWLLSAQE